MMDKGVIEPSSIEWASPVVLVPKPGGSLRVCVDYCKVNVLSFRDPYSIPRIDECLDSLRDASLFAQLTANSRFWQIPMAPEDREKTAFTTHVGLFEFNRMLFGLTNASETFQRAPDIALAPCKWKT